LDAGNAHALHLRRLFSFFRAAFFPGFFFFERSISEEHGLLHLIQDRAVSLLPVLDDLIFLVFSRQILFFEFFVVVLLFLSFLFGSLSFFSFFFEFCHFFVLLQLGTSLRPSGTHEAPFVLLGSFFFTRIFFLLRPEAPALPR